MIAQNHVQNLRPVYTPQDVTDQLGDGPNVCTGPLGPGNGPKACADRMGAGPLGAETCTGPLGAVFMLSLQQAIS